MAGSSPAMTGNTVIARSESDEAIQSIAGFFWIASLRSQWRIFFFERCMLPINFDFRFDMGVLAALLIVAMALLQAQGQPAWWVPLLKLFFTIAYVVLAPFMGPLADAVRYPPHEFELRVIPEINLVRQYWLYRAEAASSAGRQVPEVPSTTWQRCHRPSPTAPATATSSSAWAPVRSAACPPRWRNC